MASIVRTYDTGSTLYVLLRNDSHQIYSTVTEAFAAYASGSYADYDIAATEQGSCGYYYLVTPTLADGWYRFDWRLQIGASPAESDPSITIESAYWDGTIWYGQYLADAYDAAKIAASSTELSALQTHGDTTWATADVSGVATTEALAAAKTVIDTIATDTGETIPAAIAGIEVGGSGATAEEVRIEMDNNSTQLAAIVEDTGTTIPVAIAGIEGGGGTGTGARTVAIIVNDGTTALESARVRFTKGAETYVSSTNVSGQVSFSLDDGTWSVAITLAGYLFTPTTLVVDGDETQTYSMTLVTISASDPGFITGYWQCYDEDGVAEVGQTIQMRMKTCSGYGVIYDSKIRSEVSDAMGLATFTNLDPGMTYQVRRGESGKWINVTIPSTATSPYALQSIVGSDE